MAKDPTHLPPIVVGIDADGRAGPALREAAALGEQMGCPVHAVHALDVRNTLSTFGTRPEHQQIRLREADRLRAWMAGTLPPLTTPPELTVIWGNPVQVLLSQARKRRAWLIIVGSHQRRGGDIVLSGTAERVLRGASCPVLVRRRDHALERPILVPVDLSDESRKALQIGARLAELGSVPLLTLFVLPEPGPLNLRRRGSVQATRDEDRRRELVAEYKSMVAETVSDPDVRILQDRGDPRVQIAHHARQEGADLVVMGTHGRTGLARWALGSVTEALLRRSDLSVLAVQADSRVFLLEAPATDA